MDDVLSNDEWPAFSAEQGLSQILTELSYSAELITKCAENHPEYLAVSEKLQALREQIYAQQEAVFSDAFAEDKQYDKEPFLIKLYRQAYGQVGVLVQDPCWQSANFLQNIQCKLNNLLQEFQRAIDEEDPTHIRFEKEAAQEDDDKQYTKVYVSLYCVSGELHDWEKILNNIDKQVISRPILTQEEDVQTMIRSKDNIRNQAYVVLRVLESNVIRSTTADRPDHDAQGHEMVSIKDTRIDKESILYFVHENQTYIIEHGLLIAK